jgi:hypothetical protein
MDARPLNQPQWYLIEVHNRNLDRLKLYQRQKDGHLCATLEHFSRGRYVEITRQYDISRPQWGALVLQYN